jgi:hypothetical protein
VAHEIGQCPRERLLRFSPAERKGEITGNSFWEGGGNTNVGALIPVEQGSAHCKIKGTSKKNKLMFIYQPNGTETSYTKLAAEMQPF